MADDTVPSWETEKENCLLDFSEMHNMNATDKDIEVDGIATKFDMQNQLISKTRCETAYKDDMKSVVGETTVLLVNKCRQTEKMDSGELDNLVEENAPDLAEMAVNNEQVAAAPVNVELVAETSVNNELAHVPVLPVNAEVNADGYPNHTTVTNVSSVADVPGLTCDLVDAGSTTFKDRFTGENVTIQSCDNQSSPKNGDMTVKSSKTAQNQMISTSQENQNSVKMPFQQESEPNTQKGITTKEIVFRPLAKVLYDIGFSLVSERVCTDLINWQDSREISFSEDSRRQVRTLTAYESKLRVKNRGLLCPTRSCKCGFRSESSIVIALHSQYGGTSEVDDSYRSCCLCSFLATNATSFTRHMKRRHHLKALMPLKTAPFQCPFCSCENKSKHHFDRHVPYCGKLFNLNINLIPSRMYCDLPIFANDNLLPLRPKVVDLAPKPSVGCALPKTEFSLASSVNPALQLSNQQISQSKASSYQQRILGSSLASSFQGVNPLVKFVMPQNRMPTGITVQSSNASFTIPSNLVRVPSPFSYSPLVAGNLPIVRQVPLSQVPPNRLTSISGSIGSCPNFSSFSSSARPVAVLQLPSSTPKNVHVQANHQLHSFPQQPYKPVLAPYTLSSPVSPLISPVPLRPLFQNNIALRCASTASSFSKNVGTPGSTVLYVGTSNNKGMIRPLNELVFPNRLNSPALKSNEQLPKLQSANSLRTTELLICELCDGFVKNLQTLSVHFQIAHKVSVNGPDDLVLSHSCALCHLLFFTIPGLLRHFNRAHSQYDYRLVKTLAQCPLCKSVQLKSVINHVCSHHLDTMSLSRDFNYCGICLLNMGNVQLFERHMLSVHAELFANRCILLACIAASVNLSSGSTALTKADTSGVKTFYDYQSNQKVVVKAANDGSDFERMHHIKCSRCRLTFSTAVALRRHTRTAHSGYLESCPLCLKPVEIGLKFIIHMKHLHMKHCSVVVERILNTNMTKIKAAIKAKISASSHRKQSILDERRRKCFVRLTRLNLKEHSMKP